MTTLPFPVFTRMCEPYVRLDYVLTEDGRVKRELYEPVRDDTVVMVDIGLRSLTGLSLVEWTGQAPNPRVTPSLNQG